MVVLSEWFEWLALNALGVDFYYSHDTKEIAKELLKHFENHAAKSWGWSWVSILDLYYHDIEEWEKLSTKEKNELREALFEYIEKLANKD
jgi:hypothetical protein